MNSRISARIPDGQDCPYIDGDHYTSESPSPTLSSQNPISGGLNYVPSMAMALRLSARLRSDLLAAIQNADRATAPDPMRISSERCTDESRLETLKRKAAQISHSNSVLFAYCTSRTTSKEDATQLLSAVTNLGSGTYLI